MIGSLVVEVRHLAVGGDLGVNVTTLALIQVDFGLLLADALSIFFDLALLVLLFLLHSNTVRRVRLLEEGALVVRELCVKVALFVVEVTDKVEQTCVLLDTRGKLTLGACVLALSLLNLLNGLLLSVIILGHEIHYERRGSTHLERVKVDEVTKAKELLLLVFALLFVALLGGFLVFLLLVLFGSNGLVALDLELAGLDVKLTFALKQLLQLSAGEENRFLEVLGEEETSPVILFEGNTLGVFNHLLALLRVLDFLFDFAKAVHQLSLAHVAPMGNAVAVRYEVLDLLDLKDHLHVQLVELGHLLLLEVSDTLLSVSELLSHHLFTLFSAHAVLL